MKLSSGKLIYDGIELNLVSCDMYFSHAPSRDNWTREGFYSNEVVDNIEINWIKGQTLSDKFEALLPTKVHDGKPDETIELTLNDGAVSYSGKWYIGQKYNTKLPDGTVRTYERIMCDTLQDMSKTTEGGAAGEVTKSYVDTQDQSVLKTCNDKIEAATEQATTAIDQVQSNVDAEALRATNAEALLVRNIATVDGYVERIQKAYLTEVTKDTGTSTITIKDQDENEVSFTYGGGSGGVEKDYVDQQDQAILATATDRIDEEATQRQTTDDELAQQISLKANATDVATEISEVYKAIANKQDTLVAGTNITIEDNVISSTGGGSQVYYVSLSGTSGTLTDEQRATLLSGEPTINFIDKDNMIFHCVFYSAGKKAVYSIAGESKIHVITVTLPAGTWALVTYNLASGVTEEYVISKVTEEAEARQAVDEKLLSAIDAKQDTLTAGTNITIVDNVISATGGGSATSFISLKGTSGTVTADQLKVLGENFANYILVIGTDSTVRRFVFVQEPMPSMDLHYVCINQNKVDLLTIVQGNNKWSITDGSELATQSALEAVDAKLGEDENGIYVDL